MWVIIAVVALGFLSTFWPRNTVEPEVVAAPQSEAVEEEKPVATPLVITEPPEPEELPEPPLNTASAEVWATLDGLELTHERSTKKYQREFFGQTWYDYDRNGCDTRNDILGRDLVNITYKEGTNNCKVLSGTLNDWYTGTTVQFKAGKDTSRLVQVDHIVPLSWAWHHGADEWDDETRLRFANDPLNLVATVGKENQSKSDSGPGEWLPTDPRGICMYAERFTAILDEYDLQVGLQDRAMMRGILIECAESDFFGLFAGE